MHILILGSFFDTSPLGREMVVNLARHVVNGYTLQEPPSIRLLKNSVLHFMPFTENFEYIFGQFSDNSSVCDPIIKEEFADRLLSAETDKKKTIFLNMLDVNRFDLALTFSAGGFDIQSPLTENINSIFTKATAKIGEYRLREEHTECALNPLRVHQTSTLQKVTQFLMNNYKLPLYTLQVSCCKMPPQTAIAKIWRQTIHKALNFLKLTETGVKGSIRNEQSEPIRNAIVSITGNELTTPVTKNMAHFRFVLPAGQYELRINTSETIQTIPFNVIFGQTYDFGVIVIDQVKKGLNIGKAELKAISGAKLSGLVLNERNHPIEGALVTLLENNVANTTDRMGRFQFSTTPFGTVTLEVKASGHESATRYVTMNHSVKHKMFSLKICNIFDFLSCKKMNEKRVFKLVFFFFNIFRQITMTLNEKPIIFRLGVDDSVFGMTRFNFVFGFGTVGFIVVIGSIFLILCCSRRRNRNYNFHLLPQAMPEQRKLFAEDDDEYDETELFRRSTKSKFYNCSIFVMNEKQQSQL